MEIDVHWGHDIGKTLVRATRHTMTEKCTSNGGVDWGLACRSLRSGLVRLGQARVEFDRVRVGYTLYTLYTVALAPGLHLISMFRL